MCMNTELKLHKKTFGGLTLDELYELLRVRSEVFVVAQNCVYQDMDDDDMDAIRNHPDFISLINEYKQKQ